ncbi:MAG: flagellar hook-associated protein FlgK [Clostridia bacterium]|nr:flagellar hook-associated protein FlgK [Clostridia bacterium]
MSGTFLGFYTSVKGMQAQQKAVETASHNVANANTPGFSRQRVQLVASPAYPEPGVGQVGTGVDIASIARIRDTFLDGQIRKEITSLGRWEVQRDNLRQIEVILPEPSDTGLSQLLAAFWDSWQELSKRPESPPVRTTVVETGLALTEGIRHAAQQLDQLHTDLDNIVGIKVTEINSLARQIADLNNQIVKVKRMGDEPNDLMDRRDRLLDDLAQVVDFQAREQENGAINISIGGHPLVQGSVTRELETDRNGTSLMVKWKDDGQWAVISGGELFGAIDVRDRLLKGYQDQLDILARGLRDIVNEQHKQGWNLEGETGISFFKGTGARDIDVEQNIRDDVMKIAASSENTKDTSGAINPGNGDNALAIAQLRNQDLERVLDSEGHYTLKEVDESESGMRLDEWYANIISQLGVASQEAIRMVDNQNALVSQLKQRQEAISGVSIDEEVASLLQYQHAYNACAKALTILDGMLDTLINRTGS